MSPCHCFLPMMYNVIVEAQIGVDNEVVGYGYIRRCLQYRIAVYGNNTCAVRIVTAVFDFAPKDRSATGVGVVGKNNMGEAAAAAAGALIIENQRAIADHPIETGNFITKSRDGTRPTGEIDRAYKYHSLTIEASDHVATHGHGSAASDNTFRSATAIVDRDGPTLNVQVPVVVTTTPGIGKAIASIKRDCCGRKPER